MFLNDIIFCGMDGSHIVCELCCSIQFKIKPWQVEFSTRFALGSNDSICPMVTLYLKYVSSCVRPNK